MVLWSSWDFFKGQLFGLTLFAFWIEFGPKMGGILIRRDPENQKRLNLPGFFHFCCSPFWTPGLWKLSLWDLNSVIVTSSTGLLNAYFHLI